MMSAGREIISFILFTFLVVVCCQDPHSGVYVTLYPPADVTVGYIKDKAVYVYWYKPPVYIHKVTENDGTVPLTTPELTTVSNRLPDKHGQLNRTFHYGSSSRGKTRVEFAKHVTAGSKTTTNSSDVPVSLDNSTTTKTGNSTEEIHVEHGSEKPVVWTKWKPKYYVSNRSLDEADVVSFHQGHLAEYYVTWWMDSSLNGSETVTHRQELLSNVTSYGILNLQPNTKYQMMVSAVYSSVHFEAKIILKSQNITFTTKKATEKSVCHCDKQGTLGGQQLCNNKSKHFLDWCHCREEYAGVFCEVCSKGFYRNAIGLACYECPCKKQSSTGSCHFEEEYLHCDECHPGYTGNLCHKCQPGYFKYTLTSPCQPCSCHGNSYTCTSTGECQNCLYNTTGFSCERCKDHYIGDPVHNKNCTHRDDLQPATKPLNSTLIAGICVAVILLMSAIVGYIVYRRWQSYPVSKPFWTVELKDDHEGVNFSSVPEDEGHIDDLDFYDKKSRSAQKYSPLKEDI